MKFKKITLLSSVEKSALMMSLGPGATVIKAGNGFGKSALLKSLYDTFGAEPHSIDQSWRSARVVSAVEFDIAGITRTIVKSADQYAIFADNRSLLMQTDSIGTLSNVLAEMFDFRLLMADRRQQIVTPPSSYIFAPFYVDQDKSWAAPWQPFRNLYLPRSNIVLADYHSGLKPNEYYVALARRDLLASEMKQIEVRRKGLCQAIEHLKEISTVEVFFDVSDFQTQTHELLIESRKLHELQIKHRAKLSKLGDERALWAAQIGLINSALSEFDEILEAALGHTVDVQCPTCGEHYNNDIRARFNIAADVDDLLNALQQAQSEARSLDSKIKAAEGDLAEVAGHVERVSVLLNIKKEGLSLGDVIAAEGRNVAVRDLTARIAAADQEIGKCAIGVKESQSAMRRALDKKRARAIREAFSSHMANFGRSLDVRLDDESISSISGSKHARGSEGPRGIATYYYSFLHTVRDFGTSIFCPIVVDAPNQQGQDGQHLPAIISFLVKSRPKDSQLILAVEDAVGITSNDAVIKDVGTEKYKLLNSKEFAAASDYLRPFLEKIAQ